jgi:hypothetical protein
MAASFYHRVAPWVPSNNVKIRLIELFPPEKTAGDAFDVELKCRIFWTPLESPAKFKALSYSWGTGSQTHKISVAGEILEITESLDIALRHVRQPNESVTLWADQISIDQSHDGEKTEQVGRMGDIYRAATEVLVWLGTAADGSDEIMSVFSEIGKLAEDWGMMNYDTIEKVPLLMAIMLGQNPEDTKTKQYNKIAERAISLFGPQTLEAMVAWYERVWFTRVWVIQEFCLTRSAVFVCGSERATSEHVLMTKQIFNASIAKALLQQALASMATAPQAAIRVFSASRAALQDPTKVFNEIQQRCKQYDAGWGRGVTLFQLLKTLYVDRTMQATEPCDTVYALLSIANDAEKLGIKADYNIKNQANVIFAKAVKAIIANGDLEILSLSQTPKKYPGLPSWVPDWTTHIRHSYASVSQDADPLFSASRKENVDVLTVTDDLILGLTGIRIDSITDVGLVWKGNAGSDIVKVSSQLLSEVELMCVIASNRAKHYLSTERKAEAIWRIPVGDIEQADASNIYRATSTFKDAYDICVMQIESTKLGATVPGLVTDSWEASQYYTRMDAMKHKRSFVTVSGYVGMAPAETEPGDLVVVLLGAAIPYVLRSSANKWHLVGECYCDGVMDGEALNSGSKEPFFII